MFDELNLPVDMVVTHSFTPINNNIMASRIKRQQRLMKASEDGAISLAEELVDALDDLESKRLSFGDHHMTVTVFAETEEKLEAIAAEVRNIAASEGVNLVNESFAARTHFFAQHPGNGQMRSRKAAITNTNFADLAALHRGQLGKPGHKVPWGKPITLIPTPERSGFLFNYHETGQPDKEPTGGHTLILGRPGSGKSVLSAFLMTQARRCDARVFVFDYRAGMEMAVRANGGRYSAIKAGESTGLNPLRTEIDGRGQAWLSDWLATLLHRTDKPLSPVQINRIQEVVRQNAGASDAALRNWQDLASLFVAGADEGDLFERIQEWTADGRYGWIFGQSSEDTFSLDGDVVGFDLTGILDSESEKERMAVLSYVQVTGGARYLAQMLAMFDGNIIHGLAAYNAGPGNVQRYGGVPPFAETQHYVQVIPERYNLYLARVGGVDALGTIDPVLLANSTMSLTSFGAGVYGDYSLVSVQAAALRVQDIITRIGETDDIHAAMSLNTYARAELARLIAIRTRLKAAHTRPLGAAELAMASAQAREQDFMQFNLEALR